MTIQRASARASRFFALGAIIIALLVVASFPLTYFIPPRDR